MVSGIIIGQEDPSSVITLDAIITNVQGVFSEKMHSHQTIKIF